MVWGR